MTWKEMYDKERRWVKKIFIIDFYHCMMLIKRPQWRICDSAKYFGISKALCSEDIKLAQAVKKKPELELLSRNLALKDMRTNGKKVKSSLESPYPTL